MVTNSVAHGVGIARARRLRGLTVEECAAAAGVTAARWREWEDGRDWPPGPLALWPVFRLSRDALVRLGEAHGEG